MLGKHNPFLRGEGKFSKHADPLRKDAEYERINRAMFGKRSIRMQDL